MKDLVLEKKKILIEQVSSFCNEKLDAEYRELCLKMIEKLSRKREVPFLSGKLEIWAAAVIYAIGQINFLFDKSFTPYVSPDDICNFFKTTKSSTSQKAKIIRDLFKLNYYDKEFSIKKLLDSSPFNNYMMVDGLVVSRTMIKDE